MARLMPGDRWRVLAHRKDGTQAEMQNDGCFDELVVDDWLHIEQMDNRHWWAQICDAGVWIHIPVHGEPVLTIERDAYFTRTPQAKAKQDEIDRCEALHTPTPAGAPAVGAEMEYEDGMRLVTVCTACLQASCWQGIFMCSKAQNADTVDVPVYELRRLGREHSDYWKSKNEVPAPAAGGATSDEVSRLRYQRDNCMADARLWRFKHDQLAAQTAKAGAATPGEPQPGDIITKVHCPCCGAALEVMHGDEPGEIGVEGNGGILDGIIAERDKARENWSHVCDLLAETEKKLAATIRELESVRRAWEKGHDERLRLEGSLDCEPKNGGGG